MQQRRGWHCGDRARFHGGGRAAWRSDRHATQAVAHRVSGSTLAVRDLAVRRHEPILRNKSDALNPEAQCRAVRPCVGGSESRNRLSGTPTWPGFAFVVSGCSQRRTLPMASVLITGTSSGTGMATALAFGRAGHKVAATMRNPHRAPELARIATQEKLPITISTMDVDSDASVKEGIGRIVKEGGPVDVLVNNAGIERIGSVGELPLAEFRAAMETNYFGAIRCIQTVLPAMRARRSGCIVNLASGSGSIANSPLG